MQAKGVAMFDREMMKALQEDAEKLGQLTGEDHTPEFLRDCEACEGQGHIVKGMRVYEAGCGFSHMDSYEDPCGNCDGRGFFICEAEGDYASSSN